MSGTQVVAAPTTTHLLVTHEPDTGGFSLQSPQLPGFTMGRPTMTEMHRDYTQVLVDLGVDGVVRAHRQERGSTPEGGEFILREAEGPDFEDRQEVLARVRAVLNSEDRHSLMNSVATVTGEVMFVAVLPFDTLGWLIDQMYAGNDAVVLCSAVAEQVLWTMTLISGDAQGSVGRGLQTLEESGWTRETTISQVLRDDASGRNRRVLVNA